MSDLAESTSIKMPVFMGEASKYQKFKLRFMAYGHAKGFAKALIRPTDMSNMPNDHNKDDTAENQAFLKANGIAMSACYTLALEGDQVFQVIATAMTPDFPPGLAVLISEKLDKQYQPKDLVSIIEMDAKLMRVRMNIKESPVELFNRLASIKIAHSTPTTTRKGAIFCMMMKRTPVKEVSAASMDLSRHLPSPKNPKIVLTIDAAHAMFGHYDEPTTRQAAYAMGYGISRGTLKPRGYYCAMAKARQKMVPKGSEGKLAKTPNEQAGLDISTVKVPKELKVTIGEPHWRILLLMRELE